MTQNSNFNTHKETKSIRNGKQVSKYKRLCIMNYVHLSNSHVEILTPNMTVFVGGAFGRLLSPGGGVLMNEISAFINEMPERSLSSSTM